MLDKQKPIGTDFTIVNKYTELSEADWLSQQTQFEWICCFDKQNIHNSPKHTAFSPHDLIGYLSADIIASNTNLGVCVYLCIIFFFFEGGGGGYACRGAVLVNYLPLHHWFK